MASINIDDYFMNCKFQNNPDFIMRTIAGECLLIPTGNKAEQLNGMVALNDTSKFLWEQFQKPNTVANVIQAAKELYNDESGILEASIIQYVRESLYYGFIEEDKNGNN